MRCMPFQSLRLRFRAKVVTWTQGLQRRLLPLQSFPFRLRAKVVTGKEGLHTARSTPLRLRAQVGFSAFPLCQRRVRSIPLRLRAKVSRPSLWRAQFATSNLPISGTCMAGRCSSGMLGTPNGVGTSGRGTQQEGVMFLQAHFGALVSGETRTSRSAATCSRRRGPQAEARLIP